MVHSGVVAPAGFSVLTRPRTGDIGGHGHPAGDDRQYSGSHQRYAGRHG
ncbi:hypothetical protein [Amycolatopsis plumensis]